MIDNLNGRAKPLALVTAMTLAMVSAPAFAGKVNLSGLQNGQTYSQFIVKYRAGTPERKDLAALKRSLGRATQAAGITVTVFPKNGGAAMKQAVGLSHRQRMGIGADSVITNLAISRRDAEILMRRIAADPNVEYVELNRKRHAFATPNDPRYADQWHYANSAVGANVSAAWDRSTGAGVTVAVIDSGKTSHADLNANYIGGYDFIQQTGTGNGSSDDGNGRDADPTDASGVLHGNHVAGTIAAVTNNATGVAGVAHGAKVVPIRVLGRNGYGDDVDINDAIIWAAGGSVPGVPANPNPARVINLSLGGDGACPLSTQDAINDAVGRGTTVVIAAGNDNGDTANFSPGNCANVIAVAASDINGNRAWYSNYGAPIDITAPGGETCSPSGAEFLPLGQAPSSNDCAIQHANRGVLSTTSSGSYEYYDGTSMATPHVAGIVALMQAAASSPKTPAQIETLIKNTARPIPSANCPGGCGAGLIDASAAVNAAAGPANAVPVANYSFTTSGLTATFTDSSTDSDGTIASRSWNFGDGVTSTATSPNHTYAAAGTYTVTLTVTDNAGATNTVSKQVVVGTASCGGAVLCSGVAVALQATASKTWLSTTYTINVPAGKTSAVFSLSGGTGDADLYVKLGSAATTTVTSAVSNSTTCVPYKAGNTETCTFNAPTAGTYYVRVYAYSAFSGVSLKATISP